MAIAFFQDKEPPAKRLRFCDGGKERFLSEGAVILAFAFYLLDQGGNSIELHPDGEHGKRFPIRECLESRGFVLEAAKGKTNYGGTYRRGAQRLEVSLRPGVGDVVGCVRGRQIVAECKGGIINTSHAGQISRLRSGLCEAVGQLMCREENGNRHVAVLPESKFTRKLTSRVAKRLIAAGIELALVDETGEVNFVGPQLEFVAMAAT